MTANLYQPFFIEWKPLEALPQCPPRHLHRRRSSCYDPPDKKDAFKPFKNPPDTYRWTPGSLVLVNDQEKSHLKEYKACSVFWRPEHGTYLTVPYDCTQYNVSDRVEGDPLDTWETLRFGYEAIGGRCVSVVYHCAPNDSLAAPGPPNWLGELIPPVHQRHEDPAFSNTTGKSLLAGDISIIMALAALSNSPKKIKETIEKSFRPLNQSTWVPHKQWDHKQWDRASQKEYGIVVRILTDERLPGYPARLKAWEQTVVLS